VAASVALKLDMMNVQISRRAAARHCAPILITREHLLADPRRHGRGRSLGISAQWLSGEMHAEQRGDRCCCSPSTYRERQTGWGRHKESGRCRGCRVESARIDDERLRPVTGAVAVHELVDQVLHHERIAQPARLADVLTMAARSAPAIGDSWSRCRRRTSDSMAPISERSEASSLGRSSGRVTQRAARVPRAREHCAHGCAVAITRTGGRLATWSGRGRSGAGSAAGSTTMVTRSSMKVMAADAPGLQQRIPLVSRASTCRLANQRCAARGHIPARIGDAIGNNDRQPRELRCGLHGDELNDDFSRFGAGAQR
jgi:hypothetical protein